MGTFGSCCISPREVREKNKGERMQGTQGRAGAVRPLWIFNILLLVVFVSIGIFISRSETIERRFADAVAARQESGGWIPPALPDRSTQIRLKYNLDTNQRISRFANAGGLDYLLVTQCRQVPVTDVRWPKLKASWWPADLRGAGGTPRHTFFACPADHGTYAYDPYNKEGYFWSDVR